MAPPVHASLTANGCSIVPYAIKLCRSAQRMRTPLYVIFAMPPKSLRFLAMEGYIVTISAILPDRAVIQSSKRLAS